MKEVKIIVVLVFMVSFSSCFAQDTLYKVSGKVIDDKTKKPIANVGVQLYGTLYGTSTDSNGVLKLSVKENNILLKFSIIGYEDKFIRLGYKAYYRFVVALSQKTQELKEVVINGSPTEAVAKNNEYNVLDYDFYDNNILLIGYRNDLSKAKLYLLSPAFDTLSKLKLPEEPTELYKDCLGNNHVVCQNTVYQIYLDSALNLKLLPPQSIKTFTQLLYPCVAADSANLYIINKQGSELKDVGIGAPFYTPNYIIDYSYYNEYTKQYNHFVNITDERTKQLRDEEPLFEQQKEAAGMYKHGGGPTQDRLDLETMIIKEIFAPLYILNNKVYIFDFINNRLQNYSRKGGLLKDVEMTFHNEDKRWKRQMCTDEKNGRAFAVFELNGISTVKEINIVNGKVIKSYKIPFPFVKKIKAHDGYIYFLYKGVQYYDTRYLSRLKLD